MKRLFLFLLLLAALAFALLPLAASAQSSGDYLFQKKSASGPLAAVWVTPGAPPSLFGTITGGNASSFTLGSGLALSGSTLSATGGAWGSITGTLASQTDLQTALDAKASTAALASYLTTATAASTYAPLASPTFTGTVTIPSGASITGYLTTATAASTYQPLATLLTTFGGLANASGVLTNNGSGTLSYTAFAVGGYAEGDNDKLPRLNSFFGSRNGTLVARSVAAYNLEGAGNVYAVLDSNGTLQITDGTNVLDINYTGNGAISANWPTTNGTLLTDDSPIALTQLAQTAATSGQVIAWNGTAWAPATAASGATLAANTFTALQQFSGTDHAGIRLNNLTTVQRDALTGSAGMVIWNTTDGRMQLHNGSAWTSGMVRLTGDTMTGDLTAPNITSTTKHLVSVTTRPQLALVGSLTTGVGIASDRVELTVAGSVVAQAQAGSWNVGSSSVAWSSNALLFGNSDGTGRLIQRNGVNAQTFSIANTWTSFTNKEEFEIGWVGNSNVCKLRPIKGSGGGTARHAEYHTTEGGVRWSSGSGSPESVVTAPIGSLYTRTDGGSTTTLYVKESGTGNTGWIAK